MMRQWEESEDEGTSNNWVRMKIVLDKAEIKRKKIDNKEETSEWKQNGMQS